MVSYENEEKDTSTTERHPVSNCGENLSCDKAEAKAEKISEEAIDAGVKIFLNYFPDQPADWFVRNAVQELLSLRLPRNPY